MDFKTALRLFAYSKASLLYSLEDLTDDDLVWQPSPGICYIGWHACHVAQIRGAFMWFFDPEPDWESLGAPLPFGYGSDPDELIPVMPGWQELVDLIREDWYLFLERFKGMRQMGFDQLVPLNNDAGETLFEMCHRTAWHADHHVGQLCAIRELLGKPIFPRPPFGTRLRQNWNAPSSTGWEKILDILEDEVH
jgi:hypothetical protein